MADDPHYQEPTRQYKTKATNQHEEIGGVNFGALEMSPQAKNENSYLNNKNTVAENAFSPLRGRSQNPNQRLNWGPWFTVAIIIFMIISLTSLTLNILVIKGIIVAPACSERASRTQDLNNINRPYEPTSNMLEKIKAMEKNLTSLITKLQEKLASVGGSDKESQSRSNQFQENITNEVQTLREKQNDFDSSLENLKSKDKTINTKLQQIDTKFLGLAVAVNYLTLNDSLMKSRVHNLTKSERQFNAKLKSLKQKDVKMESTLRSLKISDSFFNSSVNNIQLSDENLKAKMDSLNSSTMSKIKNITNMINAIKLGGGQKGPQGPAGPPGIPGVGNLTRCERGQKYHTTSAAHAASDKASVPYIVPKDKIVIGATCSTVGGDETYLEVGKISTGQTSYLCNCLGRSTYQHAGKAKSSLKCLIDVWVCPRIS